MRAFSTRLVLLPVALAGGFAMVAPSGASSSIEASRYPKPPLEATRVLDRVTLNRLVQNKGMSLQWISWDDSRGTVSARMVDGRMRLTGSQFATNGPGQIMLDGYVTELGTGYFTFEGKIRIIDAPDGGRVCEADKSWHFAITQQRRYFRLREFEWCDDLTDYIDIYF
ncbi:hypothetical protein [Altererythrobacter sp. Z27]|uniref:hypothetical protein n=1 Tax=Altererythrobacter sp. Z27 TaxID=3461147 RepID=UPI0040442D95